MALIQLTHPEDGYELWLDPSEIVVMERYMRKKSAVLTLVDDKPDVTALVSKERGVKSAVTGLPADVAIANADWGLMWAKRGPG